MTDPEHDDDLSDEERVPPSRRRTNAVAGFVNFPLHLPSTQEGGVFVRLVVIDREADKNISNKWMPCCGGEQSFTYDEVLLGDDLSDLRYPSNVANGESWMSQENEWRARDEQIKKTRLKYFPRMLLEWERDDGHPDYHTRDRSRPFLAIVTMGATGWSYNQWVCTYDDLTDRGKELYNSLKALYAGAELRLLTFLDT